MIEIKIDLEFKQICSDILKKSKKNEAWSLIESSDMFQSPKYSGGYDADEQAFCFSYYDEAGKEFWFQVTLEEIEKIINGTVTELTVRSPE